MIDFFLGANFICYFFSAGFQLECVNTNVESLNRQLLAHVVVILLDLVYQLFHVVGVERFSFEPLQLHHHNNNKNSSHFAKMQGAFVPLAHLLDVVHIELQELEAELNPCNLGKRFRNLMMDHSWVRSTISLTAGNTYSKLVFSAIIFRRPLDQPGNFRCFGRKFRGFPQLGFFRQKLLIKTETDN